MVIVQPEIWQLLAVDDVAQKFVWLLLSILQWLICLFFCIGQKGKSAEHGWSISVFMCCFVILGTLVVCVVRWLICWFYKCN